MLSCSKCGKEDPSVKPPKSYWCRDCGNEYQRVWRLNNLEKDKASQLKWRLNNPDKVKQGKAKYRASRSPEEAAEIRRKEALRSKEHRDNLSDAYIKKLLKIPAAVEVPADYLKIRRLVMRLKKQIGPIGIKRPPSKGRP